MDEAENPFASPEIARNERRRVKSWKDSPFVSARTRGNVTRALIGLYAVGGSLSILVLKPILDREMASATPDPTLRMAASVGILTGMVAIPIAAAIMFLFWIHRAYRNLPALGIKRPAYSPGWAVGGFFVPLLNLYRPWEIMAEIWSNSVPLGDEQSVYRRANTSAAIIGWWWAALLISRLTGALADTFDASSPGDLISPGQLVHLPIFLAAATLTIIIIGKINTNQEARAEQRANLPPAAEPELEF